METENGSIDGIVNHDPIGNFIRYRLRLSPFVFGLIVFLLDVVVDGIMCHHWGLFVSKSSTPGLLQDYMALTTDFLFNPVVCGLYLWLPRGATQMFQRLRQSEVFTFDDGDRRSDPVLATLDRFRSTYSWRPVFWVSVAAMLLYGNSQILEYFHLVPWKTVGGYIDLEPRMALFRAPFWYMTIHATVFIGFNTITTIRGLRHLFSQADVRITPLHLDRCGGLAAISNFTATMGYALGAIGLLLSAATLSNLEHGAISEAYPLFLGIALYVALAPCFFFLPLSTAHGVMRDSKERELQMTAKLFREAYSEVTSGKGKDDPNPCPKLTRIHELERLYGLVLRFSVWPFDMRSLPGFLIRVAGPIVPALISIGEALVKSKLTP